MKGVTIGDRSIISAGAIVRSDVPADSLVRADLSNDVMRLAAAHQ
ncbi:MAG: hypothetical protein EOS84_24910 [Mesorhizobium sp.]|nr:MAG: hypothetical protein EOS84_24910 [Mesorhizobium sp.]